LPQSARVVLLERALKERGLDLTVSSAGTGAWDGAPASEGAYLVGLERGLDLSGHRARLLTRELVDQADLILTMARHHRARVDELGGEGKVFVLGEYAGKGSDEVSDPFGGDLACTVIPARSSRPSRPRRPIDSRLRASVEISAKTRLLTVIGDPVAHSLSPAMQNAACRALGLDAVYIASRSRRHHSPPCSHAGRHRGAGNVTVPHKEAVERSVARKTDVCARVGACNTFWTEDGGLVGDNTDVFGVAAALDQLGAAQHGERWLVVGTGGSARATAVTAADRGAKLFVRSRDASRATAFAQWATRMGVATTVASGPIEVDVAINATPLGLAGHDPLRSTSITSPVCSARSMWCTRRGDRWVHALRERESRPWTVARCSSSKARRRSNGFSPAAMLPPR